MATSNGVGGNRVRVSRYMECRRNIAVHSSSYAIDGCCAFQRSGPMGTPECMICATCGCNRNFHRKEELPPTADRHAFRRLAATASAPLPPLPPRTPRRLPAAAQPPPPPTPPPPPQPPVAPEIMEENKPPKKRKMCVEAGEALPRPNEDV